MNILFVVGEFPKLSQTFILNQMTGLIDAGHDVQILAKKAAPDRKVHPDVIRYRLAQRTFYYGTGRPGGKFQKTLEFAGGLVQLTLDRFIHKKGIHPNAFRDLFRYPNLILMIRALRRIDLTDRDVILAHFGPNGILARKCLDLGLLHGRLFTAFHGYDMLRYLQAKGQQAYQDLFRSQTTLLPISLFWKKRLIRLGADPSRTIVHHMGIDPDKFSFCPAQPASPVHIVSAARFVEKKGLSFAIRAVAGLIERGYDVRYRIAGDGPLHAQLQQQIADLGLEDHVFLAGWKTQDEWIDMMREAQMVLAPSITADDGDMEGIPVQLMEAMAMGKIVVSTLHSGIPELIQSGVNGYLVPEKDPDSLTETMASALKSPDLWPDLAGRARQTVADQFQIRRQNSQLICLLSGEPMKKKMPDGRLQAPPEAQ